MELTTLSERKKSASSQTSSLWIFAALIIAFFPDIFFAGKVYIAKTGDFHLANYSMAYYFLDNVRQGIWPMWNSLSFCGYPFGAAALSNVNITYLFAIASGNVDFAWNATIILNVLLAAWFTSQYMKRVGFDFLPGIVAGFIFAFTVSGGCFIDS